jgi:hypothetical protein
VARCGSCQPRLWLDVAWRGLMPVDVGSPFGSPVSLVPLTFSKPGRRPETSHCSRPERPSGNDRRRARFRPRGLRRQRTRPPEDTPALHQRRPSPWPVRWRHDRAVMADRDLQARSRTTDPCGRQCAIKCPPSRSAPPCAWPRASGWPSGACLNPWSARAVSGAAAAGKFREIGAYSEVSRRQGGGRP